MNIGNIKNHRMAVLEQACERYAIMAFEELNGRLAIGLKTIMHSYDGNKHSERQGQFTAIFITWDSSSTPRKEDRHMAISWGIAAVGEGLWKLYGGYSICEK